METTTETEYDIYQLAEMREQLALSRAKQAVTEEGRFNILLNGKVGLNNLADKIIIDLFVDEFPNYVWKKAYTFEHIKTVPNTTFNISMKGVKDWRSMIISLQELPTTVSCDQINDHILELVLESAKAPATKLINNVMKRYKKQEEL